ncbi:hypothetical protein VCRA2123E76_20470 [Vibrio crassostreae]|nr:hypothetical protein VCRA2123E76_20470 [Vibrio crassostreae]
MQGKIIESGKVTTINNNILKVAVGMAMLSSVPSVANAHGWSEFPSARQMLRARRNLVGYTT